MNFVYYMQTNATSYAVYHSVHDNFYWMTHFGDPDFSHHLAIGLVWIKTAMLLTTTPVLPYDPRDYALTVQDIFTGVMAQYGDTLKQQGISLGTCDIVVKCICLVNNSLCT